MKKTLSALLLVGCCAFSACSGGDVESAKRDASKSSAGSDGVSVDSCGRTITLDKAPERVVFLNAVGASQLADLDLLDRVVARSGTIDTSIYDTEDAKKIDGLPVLESTDAGHGHSTLSTESLLEVKPDLLIGYESGVDMEKVEASGVPVYIPASYCAGTAKERASFDDVTEEIDRFGQLFDVASQAEKLGVELKEKVSELKDANPGDLSGATAAMVFITPGDTGTISVYGNTSMAQAQLDALGMKNVYEDNSERVSDVSIEDILEKNPDYIALLHTAGTSEEIMSTFGDVRGSEDLAATKNDRVVTLDYPLVDPASPLSVKGLEELKTKLSS
ncbi:corrinoid ABC transporter substrate-binding protein [Corynebacterium ciconiae DSM 44920]|uniref:ABC transporter substrate-binding protein n=1 Tax=Corynebacterium ciconiae TaxID=227319 RepID=UPI00037F530E|nr:ABC transporter substrate-binding protein [Corynebacterium ciconiae]WKD60317.1 corrinoid ABC transporter substrate-binding protein [Corynebacterium ciconiae DSM 44920]